MVWVVFFFICLILLKRRRLTVHSEGLSAVCPIPFCYHPAGSLPAGQKQPCVPEALRGCLQQHTAAGSDEAVLATRQGCLDAGLLQKGCKQQPLTRLQRVSGLASAPVTSKDLDVHGSFTCLVNRFDVSSGILSLPLLSSCFCLNRLSHS